MVKRICIALAALSLVTACSAPNVPLPPAKYQGNHRLVAFTFVDPEDVPTLCGQGNAEIIAGHVDIACTKKNAVFTEVILPNPFKWPITDIITWAYIAMHELGHANDWPANHPTS